MAQSDCYNCGRKGQLAVICHSAKQGGGVRGHERGQRRGPGQRRGGTHGTRKPWSSQGNPSTGYVSKNNDDCCVYSNDNDQVGLVGIIDDSLPRPYSIMLEMNGRDVGMVVDTGSCSTLLSEDVWKQLGNPKLHRDGRCLRSYTGHPVPVLGLAALKVNHNGQKVTLVARVVRGSAKTANLLGRDWLKVLQLDWHSLVGHVSDVEQKTCRNLTKSSSQKFSKLLATYEELFAEELGRCKDFEAEIYMDKEAVPKFFKPRSLPFAQREAVGKELDRMEKRGIIEKVPYAKWAALIVPIRKPNGAIRVCGDFKVTVNPHMKVEQYPIPRAEGYFAALAGGEKFSKIDFAEAYLQVVGTLRQSLQKSAKSVGYN